MLLQACPDFSSFKIIWSMSGASSRSSLSEFWDIDACSDEFQEARTVLQDSCQLMRTSILSINNNTVILGPYHQHGTIADRNLHGS